LKTWKKEGGSIIVPEPGTSLSLMFEDIIDNFHPNVKKIKNPEVHSGLSPSVPKGMLTLSL
jgi:hypothetical protein